MKVMVERFVDICRRRRGLKVNAHKIKVKVLGGKEVLECEICGWGTIEASVRVQIFGVCFS